MMLEEFIFSWEGEYRDYDSVCMNFFYDVTLLVDIGPFKKGEKIPLVEIYYNYDANKPYILMFDSHDEDDKHLLWRGQISFSFRELANDE